MFKKILVFSIFAIILTRLIFAADLSLSDITRKIQSNQSKIKDMYAETTTTITSNITMPGAKEKTPQKMIQKGRMWTKGKNKSKIEILSPTKQVTITHGDQMMIVNPETGQKIIQDLKKMREKSGMPDYSRQMSLEKAKEFFDLSVKKKGDDYIITGMPKKENKFLGKLEFYVRELKSSEASGEGAWAPVKIVMYDAKGKPMSQSEIQYKEISDVYVPVKNISNVTTPLGTMMVEMTFDKVKINQGISDKEFEIK